MIAPQLIPCQYSATQADYCSQLICANRQITKHYTLVRGHSFAMSVWRVIHDGEIEVKWSYSKLEMKTSDKQKIEEY